MSRTPRLEPHQAQLLARLQALLVLAAVGAMFWAKSDNLVVGIIGAIATAIVAAAIIRGKHRQAEDRIARILRSPEPELDASLDITSLPARWHEPARDSLGRLGRNGPSIRLRLGLSSESLIGEKLRGQGNGRTGLRLTVGFTDITAVETAPARHVVFGSELVVALTDGTRLRFVIQARPDSIDALAAFLRRAIADAHPHDVAGTREQRPLALEFTRRS